MTVDRVLGTVMSIIVLMLVVTLIGGISAGQIRGGIIILALSGIAFGLFMISSHWESIKRG